MGILGLLFADSWAGAGTGVPVCDEIGGKMFCRDWRSAAVDCGCGALAAGIGAAAGGVGTAVGKFGRRPFLASDANRSLVCNAGVAAAWF